MDLDCRVPIELQTAGRSGQTVRSLAMPGCHRPDAVLNEGEQRAVALADFLTEASQNPTTAGIVLDDPVNSLDHQRRGRIAKRLVVEARNRQVIVFTHDLVCLNELAFEAELKEVELLGHWVDRDNEGRPGKVSLDDSPATAKLHETTQRAEDSLARAKQLSESAREIEIRTGMGALRRTLEETVVRRLLKNLVPRWSDRVNVTALHRINWDNERVLEISSL
jgi:ATPase subunit of ABC transporter with duplicated ATPase domains